MEPVQPKPNNLELLLSQNGGIKVVQIKSSPKARQTKARARRKLVKARTGSDHL